MKKSVSAVIALILMSTLPLHSEAASYSKKIEQNFKIVDQVKKSYTLSVRSPKAICHKATSNDMWWIKGKDELCTGKFTLHLNGKATKYVYSFTTSNPYVFSSNDAKTSALLKNSLGSSNVFSLASRDSYSILSLETFSILDKKLIRHSNSLTSYGMRPKMKGSIVQIPIYVNGGDRVGYIFNDYTLIKSRWVDERSHDYLASDFESKRYKNGVAEMEKYSKSLTYFAK